MKKATRQSYGEILAEIGEDKNIVVLDSDLSGSTKTAIFKEKYPERFFNVGISEQDMVCQAAGMASMGKTAFASSFAAFLTGRVYDQIRCSIAYSETNVKLVSTHAGLTLGEDGATHQMLEDISLMRALPNMEVYTASTDIVCKEIIRKISKTKNPTYVRLYRLETEEHYGTLDKKDIEKMIENGMVIRPAEKTKYEEHDIILITMGDLLDNAIEVQKKLKERNINVLIIDVFKLKPFNEKMLEKIFNDLEKAKIVTLEDHSIYGGLGSIVSEVMTNPENDINNLRTIKKIGTTEFGKSGKPTEVLKKYGLYTESIIDKIL